MRFTGYKDDKLKIKEGFLGQSMLVISPAKWKTLAKHPFTKLLYLTAIGYYPAASYHDRKRAKGSNDYILLYCVDGKGYIEENGSRAELEANSFYILDKNTPHHYGSITKKPWSIYWIHFNGEHAELVYRRYRSNQSDNSRNIPFDQHRIDLFNKLSAIACEDFNDLSMESHYLYLIHYLTSFTHITNKANSNIDNAISGVINYMNAHVKQNFEIREFAGLANYSVSRFSELFRGQTGYSPIQYFLQLKIHTACQYLSFSQMNVKQISAELAFNDPYYFSRLFKKQTGKTPLAYRKLHRPL